MCEICFKQLLTGDAKQYFAASSSKAKELIDSHVRRYLHVRPVGLQLLDHAPLYSTLLALSSFVCRVSVFVRSLYLIEYWKMMAVTEHVSK